MRGLAGDTGHFYKQSVHPGGSVIGVFGDATQAEVTAPGARSSRWLAGAGRAQVAPGGCVQAEGAHSLRR